MKVRQEEPPTPARLPTEHAPFKPPDPHAGLMGRRTKILATLGPASEDADTIHAMAEAGLDAARLNFSHGTHRSHARLAERIREAADEIGHPISIVQDLQGTKIRLREIQGDQITLTTGDELTLDASDETGTAEHLTVDDQRLLDALQEGKSILLGDGEVELEVLEAHPEKARVRVTNGGPVSTGKGITAPGIDLPGGLTEKDQEDLMAGRKIGVDYVAASFVARAADVADVKEFLAARGETTPVLAKIERRSAVENIERIADVSDGVMVARGDLGIALPPEAVPVAQKRILRTCQRKGVVSITATQMLGSMVDANRPTRAETSDVANAILDGSQVVMLSGETAIGVDPPNAVETMARIAAETEDAIRRGEIELDDPHAARPDGSRGDAIARAAAVLADELEAQAIVSLTSSGTTARRVAKFRPGVPVIGATANEATLSRLAMVWGVIPFRVPEPDSLDMAVWIAEDAAKAALDVKPGDSIVLTAGELGVPGTTNLVRVATVR